jgi:5-methylcytosine-specific restriction endonuclease McrA
MIRPRVKYDVPPEWKKRIERGFCPVCNKPKEEFEPKMKVFCTPACREKYSEKIVWWQDLREKILKERGAKCEQCGKTHEGEKTKLARESEKRWKKWISENREEIEATRAKLLAYFSKEFEEHYKECMDDRYIANRAIDWDKQRELGLNNPFFTISFEVDHKVPIADGGDPWSKDNLQILCEECHKKKTGEENSKRGKK